MSGKERACLLCAFVAKPSEFRKLGCPNCEEYLNMKGDEEKVATYTSGQWDGVATIISPTESWVARWQRNDKHAPGNYAIKVFGSLPADVIEDLEAQGIAYKSRSMDD